LNTGTLFR